MSQGREVTIRVKRYRPEKGDEPYFQEYRIRVRKDMVVLDALNYIKDHMDGSLTYRWSCRMGVCGSCGMMVDGEPVLTCATFLRSLRSTVTVEPLRYFPIVKDLVVDSSEFMHKISKVKPWIIRKDEKPPDEGEYPQTPLEVELYKQFSMCINCMICYSACPVYGLDTNFVGPAASALAYRYIQDTRDQGRDERLSTLLGHDGIWECTFIGECSTACPKDVDPALAIQRLKILGAQKTLRALLLPLQRR
ncbi:MAG: succinate dehydrogenase/fumarate reductase iron-sulfur subunit [Candidatus Geothermarchaeales archaeon]